MSGETHSSRALYHTLLEEMPSAFEAEQLFCHVTGLRGYDLPAREEPGLTRRQAKRLMELCRRRLAGEPLQYLLGEWEFYGLPFLVGEGVLIPRSDTEALVDAARGLLAGKETPVILDLCSGSGCVAIALSHLQSDARVTAVELSPDAFSYLERNIELNRSPVRAVREDLRGYVPPEPLDLLVANPPYIPRRDLAHLDPEVEREPLLALDGGEDGLYFHRAIARRYREYLKPDGALCMEVGIGQHREVAGILEGFGYRNVSFTRDLGGVERVVSAGAGAGA